MSSTTGTRRTGWASALIFATIAIVGLEYVKWHPYYLRSFTAAAQHSIGASIVSGSVAAAPHPGWDAGIAYVLAYGRAVWKALLLALVLGAGLQVLVAPGTMQLLFAGRGARLRAACAAIPSMMCTCCAAPITVGMIRSRADRSAALAYWLANPVINPATLVFIGLVLGWRWAALRLVLGIMLVFGLSRAAALMLPSSTAIAAPPRNMPGAIEGFGHLRAYASAFLRLFIQLVPEYVVLVFVLGMARAWLFPEMTPALGHATWLPPLLAAAGTLFVIPTAGEVPIVQTLQQFGLNNAAAAALLLTLPTLSLPSLAMLAPSVPARVLAMLAFGTFGFGLLAAGLAALISF